MNSMGIFNQNEAEFCRSSAHITSNRPARLQQYHDVHRRRLQLQNAQQSAQKPNENRGYDSHMISAACDVSITAAELCIHPCTPDAHVRDVML